MATTYCPTPQRACIEASLYPPRGWAALLSAWLVLGLDPDGWAYDLIHDVRGQRLLRPPYFAMKASTSGSTRI